MAECIIVGNSGGGGGYELAMTNDGSFLYPADVVVPANVTALNGGTSKGGFYQHTEIETVVFEDASKITALNADVFNGCTGLLSFQIPENVKAIPNNAFRECTSLSSVTIPSGVTSIGTYAFYGCALSSVNWNTGSASVSLGNYAFAHSGITNNTLAYLLNRTISSVGTYMFQGCNNLKDVSVDQTGNYMFKDCTSLESVTFGGTGALSTYICQDCTSLVNVTIESGRTAIGNYDFDGCRALQNVSLPNTITTIGTYAFRNCSSLQTLTLPSSITTISNANAFTGCTALTNIVLGEGWNCACSFANATALTETSLVGMLTSLADLTGQTAKTLTLGNTNLNKLSADEKLIALNKNWNLA